MPRKKTKTKKQVQQVEQNEQSVLIVDDMPENIDILAEALVNDFTILTAKSGKEALKSVKKNPPDLILLDIVMPGMDGYDVLKHLKIDDQTRSIPVICITGLDKPEEEEKAFMLGAVDYVTRPFNPPIVKARVRLHMELKKYREELEVIVTDRTNELTETNRRLVQEVEQKEFMKKAIELNEKELKERALKLEETNITMSVLMKKMETERKEIEENVMFKIRELIFPYIDKLRNSRLTSQQKNSLDLIKSNLKDVLSPITHMYSTKYLKLTPKELQIAELVKEGKSSKDIGDVLGISKRTVEFHRDSIRKKIGLKERKINLRTYLMTMR